MQREAPIDSDARAQRRCLLVIVAAAVALRLPGYLGWWFNPDEAIYLEVATTSAERARAMVANNAHPPLQYALLRALARVGTSLWWLRLPSLLAGLALVPLVFAAVRRLASARTALFAAALAAASPSAAALAGVMRPYALQQAALALALLGWAAWLAGGGAGWLAAFALALCAALGLHYSSFAALAAFGAATLALGAARTLSLRRWLALAAALVVPTATAGYLYVAHIAAELEGSGLQAEAREGWLRAQFADGLAATPGRVAAACEGLFGLEHLALAFAVVALAGGLRERRVARLALPLAALAAALALSLAGKYPLGGSRHSAWLLVFLVPLVADGIGDALRARRRPLALAALAAALLLVAGSARHSLRLSRGRALGEFLPEGTVRPGEARAVAEFLARELPAEAVLVSDHQTLNLLRAAVDATELRLRRKGDAGLARAVLGGREYLYPPVDPERPASIPWELPWQRSRAGERIHVARALEQIDARSALAERVRTHGVWLALGGWSPNPAHPDPSVDPAAPPSFDKSVGGPGLGLFRIDRAAYDAYLAGD